MAEFDTVIWKGSEEDGGDGIVEVAGPTVLRGDRVADLPMTEDEALIGSVVEVARLAEQIAARIAAGPVTTAVSAEEIREHLASRFDLSSPLPLPTVVDEVMAMLETWNVQVTHPRYLGLFNPSVTPASVVADALVAAYNPQLAAWRHAPAANEIERFVLERIMACFGYQPESSFACFTSGGSEANLSALLAALVARFPQFVRCGARGLPRSPLVFVTRESHHSIHKAAQIAGLGAEAVHEVPVDTDGRMAVDALERQLQEERARGSEPFFVVGTAGSTATGIIDPLVELAELCQRQGLWFHVDAAWGGAVALSAKLRHHLDGIELADSITCDAHKWLAVPMAAGMFFCRHRDAPHQAFDVSAPYMPVARDGDLCDPFASGVQWARRFIGLKLFMSLATLGMPRYARMIEDQTELGEYLREALKRYGWQIVNRTPLPLVCFTREGLDPAALLQELYGRQIAWLSSVPVEGRPVLRACITSFRTARRDIDEVVGELTRLATRSA